MKALHNVDQSVSALAPHRRPIFLSTYLGSPKPEIGQSISRADIIAPRSMQWKAFFSRIEGDYTAKTAFTPASSRKIYVECHGEPAG